MYRSLHIPKFIMGLLMFLYVYPLNFSFLPMIPSTRVMMGVFGGLMFILSNINKRCLLIEKDLSNVFLSLFLIVVITVISCINNHTTDYEMIIYPISVFLIICASFFYSKIYKSITRQDLKVDVVAELFISSVTIQGAIAVAMFLNPNIRELLLSLLKTSEVDAMLFDQTDGFRLVGFGASFFSAGVINVFALILMGYRFRCMQNPNTMKIILFFIQYLWIAFIGILMSRTTMLGIAFSFVIILYSSKIRSLKLSLKALSFVKGLLVLSILIITIFLIIPRQVIYEYEDVTNWAFELFINYSENKSLESASTNRLLEMLQTLPSQGKTWVIGDGRWIDKYGHYYMQTDVGYLRLVFYIGLIGTLAYFHYQYRLLKILKTRLFAEISIVSTIIFGSLLILNIKGFTDYVSYLALFFFAKPDYFVRHDIKSLTASSRQY